MAPYGSLPFVSGDRCVGSDVVTHGPLDPDLLWRDQKALESKLIPTAHKPHGIPGVWWTGVRGSWRKFCNKSWGQPRRRPNTYLVTLPESCTLLLVDSPQVAQAVWSVYGDPKDDYAIRWEKMRRDYDGIFINLPYWSASNKYTYPGTNWLYGYDVRCTAIWNIKDGTVFREIRYATEERIALREGISLSPPKVFVYRKAPKREMNEETERLLAWTESVTRSILQGR